MKKLTINRCSKLFKHPQNTPKTQKKHQKSTQYHQKIKSKNSNEIKQKGLKLTHTCLSKKCLRIKQKGLKKGA